MKEFYKIKWYFAPIDSRKTIHIALMKSQNAKILTIMLIAPLNIQTGAVVIILDF